MAVVAAGAAGSSLPPSVLVTEPSSGLPVPVYAQLVGFYAPDAPNEAAVFAPALAGGGGGGDAGAPPARVDVAHAVSRLPLYIGRGWGADAGPGGGDEYVRSLPDAADRERRGLADSAHWLVVEYKSVSRLHAVVDWSPARGCFTFECLGKVADVGRERVGKGDVVDLPRGAPLRVGTAFLYFLTPAPPAARPALDAAERALAAKPGGARRPRVDWRDVIATTYAARLAVVGYLTIPALMSLAGKACPAAELPEDEKKLRQGLTDCLANAKHCASLGFVPAEPPDVPGKAKDALAQYGKAKTYWQHVGEPAATRAAKRAADAAAAAAAAGAKENDGAVVLDE